MKRNALIIVLLFFFSGLSAQKSDIKRTTSKSTDLYAPPALKEGEDRLRLHCAYGKADILNPEVLEWVDVDSIISVDLVYTDWPKGANLSKLNKKRWGELFKILPALKKRPDIKRELIRQTHCGDAMCAESLFHGFSITYKGEAISGLAKTEINFFKRMLSDALNGGRDSLLSPDERAMLIPLTGNSPISPTLNRNNWTEMLIVADLTGSMTPYIVELLVWFKLNLVDNRIKQFLFFNDGDDTLDDKKEIGKTGGFYTTRSSHFEDVEKTAIHTIKGGFGGDWPENDVEALLMGLRKCPDCKDIVLIADNSSSMRDYELITKLGRPVKVILCGVTPTTPPHPQYLNLVGKTGGSLHLMEEDILHLMKINEGETIEIGGGIYKIKDGEFTKVERM